MILGEDAELLSVKLPPSLRNKTLAESEIGSRTGLSVVAVQQNGQLVTSLRASMKLEAGATLFLLGSVQQLKEFNENFA